MASQTESRPNQYTSRATKEGLRKLVLDRQRREQRSELPEPMEVDFGVDPGDEDYAEWLQRQEDKKKEALEKGEEFIPEEYDPICPTKMELPTSPIQDDAIFDTDDDEEPAQRYPSPQKRIVQTQSDDHDDIQDDACLANRSARAKKRTNAVGCDNSVTDV